MVTAYDFTMARLVDEAGVDMVLVGDSLGMIVQGLSTTIPVTLEEMAYHSRAVARGLTRAHLVGDLPFMSYQVSPAQAVEIVTAKIGPLFVLLSTQIVLALVVARLVFGLPIRGSLVLLFVAGMLCVLAGIGIGTFIITPLMVADMGGGAPWAISTLRTSSPPAHRARPGP